VSFVDDSATDQQPLQGSYSDLNFAEEAFSDFTGGVDKNSSVAGNSPFPVCNSRMGHFDPDIEYGGCRFIDDLSDISSGSEEEEECRVSEKEYTEEQKGSDKTILDYSRNRHERQKRYERRGNDSTRSGLEEQVRRNLTAPRNASGVCAIFAP
jgi:hypothetical protein